jgi:hypothetical protein
MSGGYVHYDCGCRGRHSNSGLPPGVSLPPILELMRLIRRRAGEKVRTAA